MPKTEINTEEQTILLTTFYEVKNHCVDSEEKIVSYLIENPDKIDLIDDIFYINRYCHHHNGQSFFEAVLKQESLGKLITNKLCHIFLCLNKFVYNTIKKKPLTASVSDDELKTFFKNEMHFSNLQQYLYIILKNSDEDTFLAVIDLFFPVDYSQELKTQPIQEKFIEDILRFLDPVYCQNHQDHPYNAVSADENQPNNYLKKLLDNAYTCSLIKENNMLSKEFFIIYMRHELVMKKQEYSFDEINTLLSGFENYLSVFSFLQSKGVEEMLIDYMTEENLWYAVYYNNNVTARTLFEKIFSKKVKKHLTRFLHVDFHFS